MQIAVLKKSIKNVLTATLQGPMQDKEILCRYISLQIVFLVLSYYFKTPAILRRWCILFICTVSPVQISSLQEWQENYNAYI